MARQTFERTKTHVNIGTIGGGRGQSADTKYRSAKENNKSCAHTKVVPATVAAVADGYVN